jgi:adenosylcobyric acid synthase
VLVADIERGGVFAQVIGTIALLPDDIRPLVKGIIINKFRGDPSIFASGVREIEARTGVPVLGVIPAFTFTLPSEDSLSLGDKKPRQSGIQIAVIRVKRISNFTDFELLEQHASVDYVPCGTALAGYDCIIIPGTKNTIDDLREIMESGTGMEILEARKRGIPIIGICGGYQMLCKTLIDAGYESAEGTYNGLGLFDAVTRFVSPDKNTTLIRRTAKEIPPILSHMGEVSGYEIHMGTTDTSSENEAFEGEGMATADGLVFGTYMHGLFQNPAAVHALLSHLHEKKGMEYIPETNEDHDPYEALADHFEEHVDMDTIARLVLKR